MSSLSNIKLTENTLTLAEISKDNMSQRDKQLTEETRNKLIKEINDLKMQRDVLKEQIIHYEAILKILKH